MNWEAASKPEKRIGASVTAERKGQQGEQPTLGCPNFVSRRVEASVEVEAQSLNPPLLVRHDSSEHGRRPPQALAEPGPRLGRRRPRLESRGHDPLHAGHVIREWKKHLSADIW